MPEEAGRVRAAESAFPIAMLDKVMAGVPQHVLLSAGIDRWTLGAMLIAGHLAQNDHSIETVARVALRISAEILQGRELFDGWTDYLAQLKE